MSGTLAALESSGGLSIPKPRVRILTNGIDSGKHDDIEIGGITAPEWEAIKDKSPQIWLFRYKRGHSPTVGRGMHSGYRYDNTRGYVHPSNWVAGVNIGRNVGGGAHTSRNGSVIPNRQTEWNMTDAHRYDAVFDPEFWFLNNNTQEYSWPILSVTAVTGFEHTKIGQSGQGGNNTGTYPNPVPGFCNSTRTRGTQIQYFAFAIAIKDVQDSRNYLIGPLTEPVQASIWPKVKVAYNCPVLVDKGRKIKVRYA